MKKDIHFTGVSGSFRKESFKSYLLNILVILLAGGVTLRILSMSDLPLFKADLYFPASKESLVSATAFTNKLSTGDGLVSMSPDIIIQLRLLNNALLGLRGEKIPHYLKKPVAAIEGTPGIRTSKDATGFTYCNLNFCI